MVVLAQSTQFVPPAKPQMLNKDTIGQVTQQKKVPTPQPDLKYNQQLNIPVLNFSASSVQAGGTGSDSNSAYLYMYDPPEAKRDVINERLWRIGNAIKAHHGLDDFAKLTEVSQDDRTYLGITQSCSQVGSVVSCIVDGPWTPEMSYGCNIGLRLDDVPSFTLYPGKIFAFKGRNIGGERPDSGTNGTIIVSAVYEPPPLPLAAPSRSKVKMEEDNGLATRVAILSGPYGADQVRTIKQIEELVTFAYRKRKASVVVLAGPFVGAPFDGKVDEAMMYDDQFDALTESVSALADQCTGLKVVIVPSLKDLAADYVFPQPAFNVAFDSDAVLGLGNPSTVIINDGPTIAVCTNDVLQHMAATLVEVQPDASLARIPRIAAQVLRSQSYYPLVPAHPDAMVDYSLHKDIDFQGTSPDILIMPSFLPAFAQKVEGTLVINPGIVNKRNFAEVTIGPGDGNAIVADRATVEIFKMV